MLVSLCNMQLDRFLPNFNYSTDYVAVVPGNLAVAPGNQYVEVLHRNRSRDADYNFNNVNLQSFSRPDLTEASHSSYRNYLYHPIRADRERIVILGVRENWAEKDTYHTVLQLIMTLLLSELSPAPNGNALYDIITGYKNCLLASCQADDSPTINRVNAINEWIRRSKRAPGQRTLVVDVVGNTAKFVVDVGT